MGLMDLFQQGDMREKLYDAASRNNVPQGGLTGALFKAMFPHGAGNALFGRQPAPMPAFNSPEGTQYMADLAGNMILPGTTSPKTLAKMFGGEARTSAGGLLKPMQEGTPMKTKFLKSSDELPDLPDGYDYIVHSSPKPIDKITEDGGFFGSKLFFANDVAHPYGGLAGGGYNYALPVSRDEILDVSRAFYHENAHKLDGLLDRVKKRFNITDDEAELLIEGKLPSDHPALADSESAWDAQSYQYEAAKELGFKVAAVQDEQGIAYIVDMLGREGDWTPYSKIAHGEEIARPAQQRPMVDTSEIEERITSEINKFILEHPEYKDRIGYSSGKHFSEYSRGLTGYAPQHIRELLNQYRAMKGK